MGLTALTPSPRELWASISGVFEPEKLESSRCVTELPDFHGFGVYNGTSPPYSATASGHPKYRPPLPPVRFTLYAGFHVRSDPMTFTLSPVTMKLS